MRQPDCGTGQTGRESHAIELDGKLILVQNVPARVNVDTGERLYAPETVKHLQALVRSGEQPKHTIETPVYEYA